MSIGIGEILLVLFVGFVVVGPADLPKIARTIAKGVKKMRALMKDVTKSFEEEIELEEIKKDTESLHKMSEDFQKVQEDVIKHAMEKH